MSECEPETYEEESELIERQGDLLPERFRMARSRIMYIENKQESLDSAGRIGRVYFSKSGKTLYYRGQRFRSLRGSGFKANYFDIESGAHYWISGPKKDGNNRLYGGSCGVTIDEDVRAEFKKLIKG